MLLAPGAFGNAGGSSWFLKADDYFKEYREYFQAQGCEVKKIDFPDDIGVEQRAFLLKSQLDAWSPRAGGPTFIVAHSMAGIDARYALMTAGLQGVKGLITIGTPHHGTRLASWAREQVERKTWVLGILRTLAQYDLGSLAFVPQLTPEAIARGKEKLAPVPGVVYASATARCKTGCSMWFWWLGRFVDLGPGDGIIEADTQTFGEDLGEYDLDHISTVSADPKKQMERSRFLDAAWRFMKRAGV